MNKLIKLMFLFVITGLNAYSAIEKITIERVNGVDVYPRPSSPNQDVSYTPRNGNWNANNFNEKIPVTPGSNYTILVEGNFMDTWDRIEVRQTNGTSAIAGITVTSTSKFLLNGKGATRWTLNVGSGVATGTDFMIRMRYVIETNINEPMTGENIKFEAVRRGSITNIAISPQPVRNGGTLNLRPDVDYTLTFTLGGLPGTSVRYKGSSGIFSNQGGAISGFGFANDPAFPSPFIVASSATTFTMRFKTTSNSPNSTANIMDLHNLLFRFLDADIDDVFESTAKAYHVACTVGALNNSSPNTNLVSVVPGVNLPDIKPVAPTSRGTLYSFGNATVTDQQGRVYKNIVVPATPNSSNLGTQLSQNGLLNNPSLAVSKVLGTDASLGTVTLHEVLMGTYVCPVTNSGTGAVNATSSFNNRFTGNMVSSVTPALPTQAALARRTSFPVNTSVTRSLPSLNVGINDNAVVHKTSIQVFTFSNRPGIFYCDNAWPVESNLTVFVDVNNNIDEIFDGTSNNQKVF
jgi:hypothetical protein